MAYFSNGTSGIMYQEKYCNRCTNQIDLGDNRGIGCPVWDMHLVSNYDREKKPEIATILDSFIPMDDHMTPKQCVMFNQTDGEIEGQLHFKG
jgi:hypothetical protein